MFRDSLLENYNGNSARRRWATLTSFVLQIMAACVCVALPFLYPDALPILPAHAGADIMVPPSGPPTPAPEQPTHGTRANRSVTLDDPQVIHAPSRIPISIDMSRDEAVRPAACVTCVVGAPPTEGPARESQIMTELVAIPHAAPTLKLPPAVRLSSGVTLGMLISKVEPQYPALARQARVQGDVFLAATIDRNGRIENLRVLSGHPMLVQAAVDAVKQWRYRPYMLGNEPVEVETQVTVRFRLN